MTPSTSSTHPAESTSLKDRILYESRFIRIRNGHYPQSYSVAILYLKYRHEKNGALADAAWEVLQEVVAKEEEGIAEEEEE